MCCAYFGNWNLSKLRALLCPISAAIFKFSNLSAIIYYMHDQWFLGILSTYLCDVLNEYRLYRYFTNTDFLIKTTDMLVCFLLQRFQVRILIYLFQSNLCRIPPRYRIMYSYLCLRRKMQCDVHFRKL